MEYRLSKFFLANFCLCIALQFAWLAYDCVQGQPVHDRFLWFTSGRGAPAWLCILVGPVLLAGYFSSSLDFNRFARMAAAGLGVGGLIFLLVLPYLMSNVYEDHPFTFKAETAVGIYVLVSQIALAVFWKPRD